MDLDAEYNKAYDTSHKVWKLIKGLDKDSLESVAALLQTVVMGESTSSSSYYDGFIDGYVFNEFDVCPTCRVVHDDDDHTAFNAAMEKRIEYYKAAVLAQSGVGHTQAPSTSPAYESPGTYI